MMHGREKSDPAILAGKPTNAAVPIAAESVERRAGAEGNASQQSTHRVQDRERVTQALDRVRQAARQRKKEKFTALLHHITVDTLRMAYYVLKRKAAPGVDGVTWQDYEADLEPRALGADHAAVGDDADAADAKTSAQPVDDRQQGGDIGGVAGPQLAAQRPAVLIHDQPDDHLMEIRAVVFRMAATTKLRAAPSLEGQAGGVHEDDAEFGEQVAPTGKQPLFHEVLAAAQRQLAGSGLIGERLAEPSHGTVEMMQLKGL